MKYEVMQIYIYFLSKRTVATILFVAFFIRDQLSDETLCPQMQFPLFGILLFF